MNWRADIVLIRRGRISSDKGKFQTQEEYWDSFVRQYRVLVGWLYPIFYVSFQKSVKLAV